MWHASNLRHLFFALSLVASLVLPTQAILFQGTSSGTWTNPTGPSGMIVSGAGTSEIHTGFSFFILPDNRLRFTGSGFTAEEGNLFSVGTLDYRNGTTPPETNFTGVQLQLGLQFTTPNSIGNQVFNYNFNLTVTPNPTGDPILDGDFLTFPNGVPTTTFNVGGDEFTLELVGFSRDNGQTIIEAFSLPEGQSTSALLYARIIPPPPTNEEPVVPEPATLTLTALGLVAVASRRRRAN